MRQVVKIKAGVDKAFTVTAMNFEDLMKLERFAHELLLILANLGSHIKSIDLCISYWDISNRITLEWQSEADGAGQWWTDRMPPDGVSVADWATLLLYKASNYILAGGKFALSEGEPSRGHIKCHLTRV